MLKHYTKQIPDRVGSRIHDNLSAGGYCFKNRLEYAGSQHSEEGIKLCKMLGLPDLLSSECEEGEMLLLDKPTYKLITHDRGPDSDPNLIFTKEFRDKLYNNASFNKEKLEGFNVSVHIRRGDLMATSTEPKGGHSFRFLPNSHYIKILKKVKEVAPESKITIFSESNFKDHNEEFLNLGCEFQINTDIGEAWKKMILSDIFIMSKSSFSYVPAIFNKNTVIYTDFWHKELDHWLNASNLNDLQTYI